MEASVASSAGNATHPADHSVCQLLKLPDSILAQIISRDDDGWFTALSWSLTCHRMHDLFKSLQPPMTVLDSDILKPNFNMKVDSKEPLVQIFEFEWDEWGDAIMQKYLMKRRRASQSVGHGLAKLFRAWTQSDAAKAWQKSCVAHTRRLDVDHQGVDMLNTRADQEHEEYWECHLSIPNLRWDTDNRVLQKHFTLSLQPLVHALTQYAHSMGSTVPHVSVFMSNYDDSVVWPKYADPPPWTCHTQLETQCTCGDPTAECAVERRCGSDHAEAQSQPENELDSNADSEAEFESQPSSDFDAKFDADWEVLMKSLEEF